MGEEYEKLYFSYKRIRNLKNEIGIDARIITTKTV